MRWRLSRLPHHEALDVAVIMNARGVMEMVWLGQLHAGLVDAKPFSALLVMASLATLLTPVILKGWMASPTWHGTASVVTSLWVVSVRANLLSDKPMNTYVLSPCPEVTLGLRRTI